MRYIIVRYLQDNLESASARVVYKIEFIFEATIYVDDISGVLAEIRITRQEIAE
jgi:hypothetical protein